MPESARKIIEETETQPVVLSRPVAGFRMAISRVGRRLIQRLYRGWAYVLYRGPWHDFRLRGRHPLRLLGTPQDFCPGSVAAGAHIMAGYFHDAGRVLHNPAHPDEVWTEILIWQADWLSPQWQRHLHSFVWLRDMDRVVDRPGAVARAMELTRQWITRFERWHPQAWESDIMGQRIFFWMAYAPLILDTEDLVYRSRLLNLLARQARHLFCLSDHQILTRDIYKNHQSDNGVSGFYAVGGLIMAGLYLPYREGCFKRGAALLPQLLARDYPAKGCCRHRNPQAILDTVQLLILVQKSCITMGKKPPACLDFYLPVLAALLKQLCHGDGRLALFNGAQEGNGGIIAATMARVHQTKDPATILQSGYRQIMRGSTRIILDLGPPGEGAVSQRCHAGTLSFEMSHKKQRVVVNCGSADTMPDPDSDDLYPLTRSTAAHSTLVLADRNSTAIGRDGLMGRGLTRVSHYYQTKDGHALLEASHDGYVRRFGMTHHRALYMNAAGDDIRGEDRLAGVSSAALPLPFVVRFHLHPAISASRQKGEGRLLLRLPDGECWQFQCNGGILSLEDSLYFGLNGPPQKSRQITLSGNTAAQGSIVKWSFQRLLSGG